jgi:hypothetical protein
MDSRLAAHDVELSNGNPIAARTHPPVGFLQRYESTESAGGEVRAAFAHQIAGVDDVHFQWIDHRKSGIRRRGAQFIREFGRPGHAPL